MTNESMNGLIENLKGLAELRKNIMRDFNDKDVDIIANHGIDYFIHEHLAMNDKEYEALKKIRKIISAYCTESEDRYEKELEGNIEIPYYTLKTIVNDLEERMKEKDTHSDTTEEKAKHLCEILNMLPVSSHNWIECYVKYVKDHNSVINALNLDDNSTQDEKVGNVLDAIKDSVIDACIDYLKVNGEIELDSEIMSEVASKLWHEFESIRINIVNNKLKVEFK